MANENFEAAIKNRKCPLCNSFLNNFESPVTCTKYFNPNCRFCISKDTYKAIVAKR